MFIALQKIAKACIAFGLLIIINHGFYDALLSHNNDHLLSTGDSGIQQIAGQQHRSEIIGGNDNNRILYR